MSYIGWFTVLFLKLLHNPYDKSWKHIHVDLASVVQRVNKVTFCLDSIQWIPLFSVFWFSHHIHDLNSLFDNGTSCLAIIINYLIILTFDWLFQLSVIDIPVALLYLLSLSFLQIWSQASWLISFHLLGPQTSHSRGDSTIIKFVNYY